MSMKTLKSLTFQSSQKFRLSPPARTATAAASMRTREADFLRLQQTVGNRATQGALYVGPSGTQVPVSQTAPTRQAGNLANLDWATLVRQAHRAFNRGDRATAMPLYQEAIARAARNATFPSHIKKTIPSRNHIQIAFGPLRRHAGMDEASAVTDGLLVENAPEDYWSWISFAPNSLRETQAYTEAIITHELVHVGRFQLWWHNFEASGEPKWEDYLRHKIRSNARHKGPLELEGHITSLAALSRMVPAEQDKVLRSVFQHYLHTANHTSPQDLPPEITTADAAATILNVFNQANAAIKKRIGTALWEAVIDIVPSEVIWNQLATNFRTLFIVGWNAASAQHKQIYLMFLKDEGLKRPWH